jgi:hypothetical protein
MIYKLLPKTGWQEQTFARIDDDGLCRLTCVADNPEFQNYIKNGGELQDADGNVMADAKAYVATLP